MEATGTVPRASTVARWADVVRFTGFKVQAIDNPYWRFHHLHG